MKVDYPCKDCAERYVGCHHECDMYKDATNKQREISEIIRKQKYLEDLFVSFRIEGVRKVMRGRRY